MQEEKDIFQSLVRLVEKVAVSQGYIKKRKGDINYSALGRKARVPQGTVSRVLRGKMDSAGVENMARLLKALEFPIEEVLADPKTLEIILSLKKLTEEDKNRIIAYIRAKEDLE